MTQTIHREGKSRPGCDRREQQNRKECSMNTETVTETNQSQVVNGLARVLADSYALLGQAHLAHWNVEGPAFFALHNAFEEQYRELFNAVDEIAERIRALGALAPGGLATLAAQSGVEEMVVERAPANDYVAHLIDSHEVVVESLKALRDAAEQAGDLETQDLAIARIQSHQKTLWMLRSYLEHL